MTKQQDISISGISISPAAQWKMALHATTKPRVVSDNSCIGAGGRPVFFLGIVLGHRDESNTTTATTTSSSMVITDVVPVCRETPTKPIVDMALRLVEAHLMKKKQRQTPPRSASEGTKIVGLYTNSSSSSSSSINRGEDDNQDEGDEDDATLPNPVVCRILSSIAEASSSNGAGGEENDGPFVLVSLSQSKLNNFITNKNDNNNNNASLMIQLFKAFQWETKSRTLARRKNVTIDASANDDDDDYTTKEQRQSSRLQMVVYDFVDHLNDCDFVDSNWIENVNN